MLVKELVVATQNKDKVREIKNILKGVHIKILTPDVFGKTPKVVEDGKTFEANAAKKARIISRFTHRMAIADDSGLEVKTLGGRPGIRSSRFAGSAQDYLKNNRKLLGLMKDVPARVRSI
ncbi:hypothetical protein L6248_02345 [Candidatus Parcubacteria bacterium]|nr:hypothetical protein [Candidatus Parcubacteria bacterium]